MSDFTEEQIKLTREAAIKLYAALNFSRDSLAREWLDGVLGGILMQIIHGATALPVSNIPHFELITRGVLSEVQDEYMDFYSLAQYGKPAFEKSHNR